MKKIFLFFSLVVFSQLLFSGELSHTYHFNNPIITQKGIYQQVDFGQTMQSGRAGNPSLPYQAIKLLLPPGEMVTSMEIIRENEQLLEGNYVLRPYQPSQPLSTTTAPERLFNTDVYQSTKPYPTEAGRLPATHFMNGFGFALGAFTPINLIPATGQLSYFESVTIVLHTAPKPAANEALNMLQPSEKFSSRAKQYADNPREIAVYTIPADRTTDQYKLLIITSQQFADGFSELTDMYLERGIRWQIATKEDIIANGTGNDVPEKIRNYIIDEYQNHGVEFVLLGGDVEVIPYRGFFCHVESGGGYDDDGIPADLYYSALDGNWNSNGNNLWGEPDEDDLLPDVAVARFPFSNPTEQASMIHKSHYYQNFPVTGELTNALMAGEYLYGDPETWGSDYLELLIGQHDDNGYTTNGIPEDYNFEKLYEENQSWSKYDLMNSINSGKQMVHHVGHAAQTYVAYMSNSDITNANFSGANGIDHNYTLLQTHGCDCGAFDYNDCILEKMVTIDNFAVAIMGNSRFGWFNEGQTEGPAAHLHREMMDALYGEEIRFLGSAFMESKIQTAPWVEAAGQWEEGALRWNFYDLNTLGDPAMSVWTSEPITIDVSYESEIVMGSTSYQVTVNSGGAAMTDFTCSVLKDGILVGTANTNTSGVATITFDEEITEPGDASLIVVGRNCLPTEYSIQIIPGNGAYVVYSSYEINDEPGNNNQLADYGETIMLTVTVGNVGLDMAQNLTGTLSTTDEFVTITDDTADFGDIAAGQQTTVNDAFTVLIHDNVPDQHQVIFSLNCQTTTGNWESTFDLYVQAPALDLGEITISDATGGNNSNTLDPGETDTLQINASNFGHSNCTETQVELTTTSPWITMNNTTLSLNDLVVGETKVAGFEVMVDDNAPIGTVVELVCHLSSGSYSDEKTYYLPIGLVMEDFETGDFSRFGWQHGGQLPWTIDGQNPYEGAFSARSGDISDYSTSELIIDLEVLSTDQVSFWSKVSSEEDYDFLRFYLNGNLLYEASGTVDWVEKTFPVNAGTHELKWVYEKDINTASGADAAWLDNIIFPATGTILGVHSNQYSSPLLVFPNPTSGEVSIQSNSHINTVSVYDLGGRLIQKENGEERTLVLQTNQFDKGIYFLQVETEEGTRIEKLIVQ